jgi:hypothetical protein
MDWTKIIWFAVAFIAGEIISLVVFYMLRKKYEKNNTKTFISVIKGQLERFAILMGLVASIPTIIIFFSAIKLGTRLKEQQESAVSNDYFLIGNMVSIIIAVSQFLTYQQLNA